MLRPFVLHQPCSLDTVGELLVEHRDESALYAGSTRPRSEPPAKEGT